MPFGNEAAMLAAVIKHPTDRDARLVYADAVQEAGTEEAEEYAVFIRRSIAGDRPRGLPDRVRRAIGAAFGGPVPVYHELQWANCFTATSHFGSVLLTWCNGMIADFTGPAVWGWGDLWRYLYGSHPVTSGTITDPVGRWYGEVRQERDDQHRRQWFKWAGACVAFDQRELFLRREPPSGSEIRRFMFHNSWPRVRWFFKERR